MSKLKSHFFAKGFSMEEINDKHQKLLKSVDLCQFPEALRFHSKNVMARFSVMEKFLQRALHWALSTDVFLVPIPDRSKMLRMLSIFPFTFSSSLFSTNVSLNSSIKDSSDTCLLVEDYWVDEWYILIEWMDDFCVQILIVQKCQWLILIWTWLFVQTLFSP